MNKKKNRASVQKVRLTWILVLATLLNAAQAVELKAPPPNNGSQRADQFQGHSLTEEQKARLAELKHLADSTVGWTISHIGPLRSVKMDRLRAVYNKTTVSDIPLLITLLSDRRLGDSSRQAVRYLLAMYGEVSTEQLRQSILEHPALSSDVNAISEYMESRPWEAATQ